MWSTVSESERWDGWGVPLYEIREDDEAANLSDVKDGCRGGSGGAFVLKLAGLGLGLGGDSKFMRGATWFFFAPNAPWVGVLPFVLLFPLA